MLSTFDTELRIAALKRIDSFEHREREDIQLLTREIFASAIEDAISEWRSYVSKPDADLGSPFVKTIDMFDPCQEAGYTHARYPRAVKKLNFKLIPNELAADVQTLKAKSQVTQQVRQAICMLAADLVLEKAKEIEPEVVAGYTSGVTVHSLSEERQWYKHENTGIELSFELTPMPAQEPRPRAIVIGGRPDGESRVETSEQKAKASFCSVLCC